MKKLLLLFLIVFISKVSFAHRDIGASEITYRAMPQLGLYEITLVLYRWCGGIQLCASGCGGSCNQIIKLVNADNAVVLSTITLQLVNVSEAIVRSTHCGVNSNCTLMGCKVGGTESGIERYEF